MSASSEELTIVMKRQASEFAAGNHRLDFTIESIDALELELIAISSKADQQSYDVGPSFARFRAVNGVIRNRRS
jgi:hypothetical protein